MTGIVDGHSNFGVLDESEVPPSRDLALNDRVPGDESCVAQTSQGPVPVGPGDVGSFADYVARMKRLHDEVNEFWRRVLPTKDEVAVRKRAVRRVITIVNSIWPRTEVVVYGSCGTGLFLADSDVDLFVHGLTANLGHVYRLKDAFENSRAYKDIRVISGEKPMLKIIERRSGLAIDVNFNVVGARENTQVILAAKKQFWELEPLVLVLKTFLRQRNLHLAASGGLVSHSLTLMVLSYLQLHPLTSGLDAACGISLGVHLTNFLKLYGFDFDYSKCICVRDGGSVRAKEDVFVNVGVPDALAIEDPSLLTDAGRSCFNFPVVRNEFRCAHHLLEYLPLHHTVPSSPASPATSPLATGPIPTFPVPPRGPVSVFDFPASITAPPVPPAIVPPEATPFFAAVSSLAASLPSPDTPSVVGSPASPMWTRSEPALPVPVLLAPPNTPGALSPGVESRAFPLATPPRTTTPTPPVEAAELRPEALRAALLAASPASPVAQRRALPSPTDADVAVHSLAAFPPLASTRSPTHVRTRSAGSISPPIVRRGSTDADAPPPVPARSYAQIARGVTADAADETLLDVLQHRRVGSTASSTTQSLQESTRSSSAPSGGDTCSDDPWGTSDDAVMNVSCDSCSVMSVELHQPVPGMEWATTEGWNDRCDVATPAGEDSAPNNVGITSLLAVLVSPTMFAAAHTVRMNAAAQAARSWWSRGEEQKRHCKPPAKASQAPRQQQKGSQVPVRC